MSVLEFIAENPFAIGSLTFAVSCLFGVLTKSFLLGGSIYVVLTAVVIVCVAIYRKRTASVEHEAK
jgi:hypothetical protein